MLRKRRQERADDVPIDVFESFHLGVDLALMRRFIRGLDMNADEIVIRQRRDAVAALGGIVGVEIAGGTGHVDPLPAQKYADAPDQVHGADDGAALTVDLDKRPQLWGPALAPEPDLRGWRLAPRPSH